MGPVVEEGWETVVQFDMGQSTLSTLGQQTQGQHEDLGSLVKKLVAAVTPLEGKFNGAGRAAFDAFKANANTVADDLNSSLAQIIGGQSGMNTAYQTGDQEFHSNATRASSQAPYTAATLRGQR